jgi:hypothetical protein
LAVRLEFSVEEISGTRGVAFEIRGAVLCGYTGRDQSAVRKHIEELAKEGVPPPPSVPTVYPKPPQGIALGGELEVAGLETSGEVEFVLLAQGSDLYVGVGSDHTDRELERLDILKSKQVCPCVLSSALWRYEEFKERWDQLVMRSWVTQGGERVLYQETTLATILSPEDLFAVARERVDGSLDGIAIFSGTTPLRTERMIFAERFEGEILDPVLQRRLTVDYLVRTWSWFRG